MKTLKIILMATLFPMASWAQGQLGLGAIIGEPTGISGEVKLDTERSVDFAVAWERGSTSGTHIHSDYLITRPQIGKAGTMDVDLFYGIGGRLIFITKGKYKDDVAIGPRAPIGVSLALQDPNVTFFAQGALILDLTPDTDVDLDIGIGVRYYF